MITQNDNFINKETEIVGDRSKKVELLSFVFNHVIGKTVRGFNMLALGWTDGFSFTIIMVKNTI